MDKNVVGWFTANGNRIPILEGQSKSEALVSFVARQLSVSQDETTKERQITENKKQADNLNQKVDVSNYLDNYVIKQSDISIGGGIAEYKRYLKDKGFSDDVVEQARQLTSEHSGPNYENADKKIVEHLESGDELGKCFEATIEWEEAHYKAWIDKHKNDEDAWKSKIYNGEKRIYRKGNRKSGVEPWTTREEGADMGHGGIGVDHTATVEQLMHEGYHILGGIGRHLGSPGEGEITFVKYKKR